MPRKETRRSLGGDLRRAIPYVGDNLDRLLGLLERARDERACRDWADREASYRVLAAAIVAARPVRMRTCA